MISALARITSASILGLAVCTAAPAALVTGPDARLQFEQFRDNLGDTFVDFESVPLGTYTRIPGLPFSLETTLFRWPPPGGAAPAGTPVIVWDGQGTHNLIGVRDGNIADGQSTYELVFDTPQRRAGMLRPWSTYSLTRFYDAGGALLAEHRNTVGVEFVGFIAHSDDPADWVSRIVFDGLPELVPPGRDVWQVGTVDDLFFGSVVPVPAAVWLLAPALAGLAGFARRS